jgi:hypothetical protein
MIAKIRVQRKHPADKMVMSNGEATAVTKRMISSHEYYQLVQVLTGVFCCVGVLLVFVGMHEHNLDKAHGDFWCAVGVWCFGLLGLFHAREVSIDDEYIYISSIRGTDKVPFKNISSVEGSLGYSGRKGSGLNFITVKFHQLTVFGKKVFCSRRQGKPLPGG